MGYETLKEFVDSQELLNILIKHICVSCEKEDCNGCETSPDIDKLDGKICDDTIKFMKEAALKASDEYKAKIK